VIENCVADNLVALIEPESVLAGEATRSVDGGRSME
jgi:hypothetical protein